MDALATDFRSWAFDGFRAGARLVVLEGLPCAGKSSLLRQLKADSTNCYFVELDDCLADVNPEEISWADTVIARGAFQQIEKWIGEGPIVVEGAAAWRVVRRWPHLPEFQMRRAYLRSVSQVNGVTFWDAGDGLAAHAATLKPFLGSIYAYHAEERPWETADRVFDRVEA